MPPSLAWTVTCVAPASSAFSSSSFRQLAGRWMTCGGGRGGARGARGLGAAAGGPAGGGRAAGGASSSRQDGRAGGGAPRAAAVARTGGFPATRVRPSLPASTRGTGGPRGARGGKRPARAVPGTFGNMGCRGPPESWRGIGGDGASARVLTSPAAIRFTTASSSLLISGMGVAIASRAVDVAARTELRTGRATVAPVQRPGCTGRLSSATSAAGGESPSDSAGRLSRRGARLPPDETAPPPGPARAPDRPPPAGRPSPGARTSGRVRAGRQASTARAGPSHSSRAPESGAPSPSLPGGAGGRTRGPRGARGGNTLPSRPRPRVRTRPVPPPLLHHHTLRPARRESRGRFKHARPGKAMAHASLTTLRVSVTRAVGATGRSARVPLGPPGSPVARSRCIAQGKR